MYSVILFVCGFSVLFLAIHLLYNLVLVVSLMLLLAVLVVAVLSFACGRDVFCMRVGTGLCMWVASSCGGVASTYAFII